MRAWARTWLATLACAWGTGALLGLLEALAQWLRFGAPAELPGAGLARACLPPAVLCGAAAVGAALLIFPAAALLARRAARPRRVAALAAVGGVAGGLALVWAGYLLREHLAPAWWDTHGRGAGALLLAALWLGVTFTVGRLLGPPAEWLARRPAWWLLAPLVLVLAGAAAWPRWRADEPRRRTAGLTRGAAPSPAAPNVLLLSIDAWRRDRLALLNPGSPPTPALDALAAQGTLYDNAWSPSPWTLPGAGALLTGLPPGALDVGQSRSLPSGAATLATLAWNGGWETAAVVTNPFLSRWYGFDRGFDTFEHAKVLETLEPAGHCLLAREATRYAGLRVDADEAGMVVPKAIAWLRGRDRARPFFLWVHLLDPHLPYTWHDLPPAGGAAADDGLGVAPRAEAVPDTGVFAGRSFSARTLICDGGWRPDGAARRAIAALYDREVQYADAWAGRLFAELRRQGLMERTLIVVTADHGEELFDHGGFEHGHSLLPEVTGVPLIVRRPGGRGAGGVVHAPVSLLDVAPTLAAAAGWRLPAACEGRDLDALTPGPVAAPLVLENLLYGPQQLGILAWPWLRVGSPALGGGIWYDLGEPATMRPAGDSPPAGAGALEAAVAARRAAWATLAATLRAGESGRGEAVVPAEIKRQLRSLGY